MKILFKTNVLNYRGTTNAILEYAKYNESILGNESIIAYNSTILGHNDMCNVDTVVYNIKQNHKVLPYTSNDLDYVNDFIETSGCDVVYELGSGGECRRYSKRTVNHAVFQFKNDSIDAYISKWLSDSLTDGKIPFVPHIVDLPEPIRDYREHFDIPKDAIVLGRHGASDTFDIPFVKDFIIQNIESMKNVYFIFVNTEPFMKHDRVIHVGPIFDKQKISNFISTCNGMIHARSRGESFGLSVAEFLFHDKPVISWNGGPDKNHLEMLKGSETLYSTQSELYDIIQNVKNIKGNKDRVEMYTPKSVMKKFREVFDV